MKQIFLAIAFFSVSSFSVPVFGASEDLEESGFVLEDNLSDSLVSRAQAQLRRDIKCSDDGRLCLECFYKDNGDLLYCDVWILPARANVIFEPSAPLRNKSRAISTRVMAPNVAGSISNEE